ncbi:hypothetical protein BRD11_03930, partial [Halobacteriales archaeon SW_12_69_24]
MTPPAKRTAQRIGGQSGAYGFVLYRTTNAVWHAGVDTFRGVERLSLADGLIAAYARHHDIDYVYSFDGGFDGVDNITR